MYAYNRVCITIGTCILIKGVLPLLIALSFEKLVEGVRVRGHDVLEAFIVHLSRDLTMEEIDESSIRDIVYSQHGTDMGSVVYILRMLCT